MRKYHHLGIPTKEKKEGEVHLMHLKVYVSGYKESLYDVEWMRFEPDAPYPELVKTVPHVAFEVDDLEQELEGKKVIIEPNSPNPGVTVAFIEDHGAPVEFLQIDKTRAKDANVFTNMSIRTRADSEIDELYKGWSEAFQRKNVHAILDLLTQDYVLWPTGAPAINRDSLVPTLEATFSAYDITPSFEREERLVAGDFAFERGWDIQRVRPHAGGEVTTHRQRVFLVLQRGEDGRWRFARGMSQSGPAA